ncbi:kinase-like domain, phloem protein 2-like protein [Tanacetum coccineum]
MERGFLSQKRSGGGRGVKEKSLNSNLMNNSSGICVSTESDDTMNEDTPVGVASAVNEGVTPSVVDMTVEMEKISSLEDTTVLRSFPPLLTPVTTTVGNAPGKSSYANVTSKPSGKKPNIRTLFTPRGNGIDVVVLVESIRAISERFANTAYGFFLGMRVAYPVVANYVRNTWEGLDAMLENGPWVIRNHPLILKKWHPDENLLKEDVSTIPVWVKLHGVPVTAFSEDGLSVIATKLVMVELRADVELKDNIIVAMPRIKGEGYYTCNIRVEYEWKPPRWQGFKPKQVFQPVSKKSTANTRSRMNNPESTKEVSKSNPFKVLTSVDNDVDLGLWIMMGTLVPMGIVESDSEVEVVFDETANLRISTSGKDGSDKGYDTNSFLGKGLSNLELYKKLYNKNRHEGDHCDATKVARAHGIIANVVDLALDLYLDPGA